MFQILNSYGKHLEYFPIVLVTLLLITETELEKHALNMSCQVSIMVFTVLVFYLLILKFQKSRIFAFLICCFVWVILVYVKKKIMVR